MAGNYVEILVKSRDEAKPDLEDLKARLEELKHEVARARVEVDDGGDAAKLDRMAAKLADLDHRTANPKIRVSGALRAEAEIHAVEASLDHLDRKGDESRLSRMFTGLSGAIDSALSASVPFVGSVQNLGLLAPAIGALAVEVLGVASGFAAAGAGAAAFYVLAHPAINNLQQDVQALSKANQALGYAQQAAQIDPTKANLKALQAAQVKYQAIYQQMGQDAGPAAAGVLKLHDAYVKLSNAFQPQVFKVFADGLKVVGNLLPQIVPFANTFANVLDSLLKQAAKFTASKGFADWLKQFHSLEGPALNAIGQGIAKVANAIGKLLTTVSGKDAAHAINILFDGIAGAIKVVTFAIHTFMQNWDSMSRTASRDAHDVASSFDAIRHGAAALAGGVASAFKQAGHAIASWVSDVAHYVTQVVTFFRELPGKILAALGNLGSLLEAAGRAVIMGFLHGLESAWGAVTSFISGIGGWIASHKGPIDADLQLLVPHGRAIMQGLMDGMRSRYGDLRAQLGEVSGMVSGLGGGAGGLGGGALQLQVMPGGGSAFEQFMVLAMRNYVRVRGGNVQQALGH